MENSNVRWQQRFSNYQNALSQLAKFVQKGKDLNEMEEMGMIQAFEFTYELAWNTIKDFYETQGETGIQGSRDAIQLAFKRGLIKDGETWMQMLKDRNRIAHTYNEKIARQIAESILDKYFDQYVALKNEFETISNKK
jgi:nucleotidyltransferase substrate binding protein (TIGR01987 family)